MPTHTDASHAPLLVRTRLAPRCPCPSEEGDDIDEEEGNERWVQCDVCSKCVR